MLRQAKKKSISPYTTKLFTFQQPEQSRNEVWRRENLKTANFQEKKRVHTGMAQETGKIGQVHCIPTPRSRVAGCRRSGGDSAVTGGIKGWPGCLYVVCSLRFPAITCHIAVDTRTLSGGGLLITNWPPN
jgi:hypothetical protein